MAEPVVRCRPFLGPFVEITADSAAAVSAGFESVARVHRLMSAHAPESDVSRINRFAHCEPVTVDVWTAAVLERALEWSRRSDGLFDVVRAGFDAVTNRRLPRHEDQPLPAKRSFHALVLDGVRVRLTSPAALDLGGIAKGYAVDRAIAAMKASGAKSGFVNAGGDLAGFGVAPWTVDVVHPTARRAVARIAVRNGAMATSAVLPGGEDSHLPDRDKRLLSATACAPLAVDADALATLLLSGAPVARDCLALARAEALLVASDGSIRRVGDAAEAA